MELILKKTLDSIVFRKTTDEIKIILKMNPIIFPLELQSLIEFL